jgi:hypothetical protein
MWNIWLLLVVAQVVVAMAVGVALEVCLQDSLAYLLAHNFG